MIFIIILNSISLSLYDYSDRNSTRFYNQTLDKLNLAFTSAFIAEASLKIIANGLILHKGSYLRNGWNIIDAIVVISG